MRRVVAVVVIAVMASTCSDGDDRGAATTSPATPLSSASACDHQLLVFFEPGTSRTELDEAASAIADVPGVERVAAVAGAQARAEAERMFARQPEVLAQVIAAGVPAWLKVRVSEAAVVDRVEAVATSQPGFTSVTRGDAIDAAPLPTPTELDGWCDLGI